MARTTDRRKQPAATHHVLLAEGARRLATTGVEHARREAEWLLADVLGRSRAMLYARPQQFVAPEKAEAFRTLVQRRAGGEPLQYVLGHADFFGLRLAVSPAVLIPRPETEEVTAAALGRLAGVRQPAVLDVGTGSGCIALALQAERPGAEVHACDVSAEALGIARANAATCALGVRFFQADVRTAPPAAFPRPLDLLVSNPPYVPDDEAALLPEAVRAHEPSTALFSGPDPLRFYRILVERAAQLLAPGGALVLETHTDHARAVAALLRRGGLCDVTVEHDVFGNERIVAGEHPPEPAH